MSAEQLESSSPKRKLDHLDRNNPEKVKIFCQILNRKSDRELFKSFKGKIVQITGTTFITDKDKVNRWKHFAVRLKSIHSGF